MHLLFRVLPAALPVRPFSCRHRRGQNQPNSEWAGAPNSYGPQTAGTRFRERTYAGRPADDAFDVLRGD